MGIWILLAISISFLVYLASQRSAVEPFQSPMPPLSSSSNIYTNLQIRMCPDSAPVVQTSKGFTDCCEGDFLDGKCRGTTVATLSPSHDGIESVIDYWRRSFGEKAKECPSTMPFYYEDVQKRGTGQKGCATQQPAIDGQRDARSARSCVIYPTMTDNYRRADSCYIEKIRSQLRCPPTGTLDAKVQQLRRPTRGIAVFCSGLDENALPYTCYEDESLWRYLRDRARLTTLSLEEFKTNSRWSDLLCSNFAAAQAKRVEAKRQAENEARKRREAEQRARDAETRFENAERERLALLEQVKESRR
jgi:hypothetical protein